MKLAQLLVLGSPSSFGRSIEGAAHPTLFKSGNGTFGWAQQEYLVKGGFVGRKFFLPNFRMRASHKLSAKNSSEIRLSLVLKD